MGTATPLTCSPSQLAVKSTTRREHAGDLNGHGGATGGGLPRLSKFLSLVVSRAIKTAKKRAIPENFRRIPVKIRQFSILHARGCIQNMGAGGRGRRRRPSKIFYL